MHSGAEMCILSDDGEEGGDGEECFREREGDEILSLCSRGVEDSRVDREFFGEVGRSRLGDGLEVEVVGEDGNLNLGRFRDERSDEDILLSADFRGEDIFGIKGGEGSELVHKAWRERSEAWDM